MDSSLSPIGLLATVYALTISSCGSYVFGVDLVQNLQEPMAQELAESSLPNVVEVLEERLGISFPGIPPVKAEIDPRLKDDEESYLGSFNPDDGNVYITPSRVYFPDQSLVGWLLNFFEPVHKYKPGDVVLAHELGHYLVNARLESLGMDKEEFIDKYDIATYRVIHEGTARYFALAYIDSPEIDEISSCPERVGLFVEEMSLLYHCGHFTVRPFLDADVERGIELLLTNPPPIKEGPSAISEYQETMVLEQLSLVF